MQPVLTYLQYLGFAFLVMFITQMIFGRQSFTQMGLNEMYVGISFGIFYTMYMWFYSAKDSKNEYNSTD